MTNNFQWTIIEHDQCQMTADKYAENNPPHKFCRSYFFSRTMQFLSEIINIRDGVFILQYSDGLTLSWHEFNAIVLYLATDRQTWNFLLFFYISLCTFVNDFYFK